ncbi:MAG TPA: sigma factor-like helix-turn-helix DNA-binding protein [Acidimicrobiales bacterium]|nr:sigma factor-like helix-turn-helix DNA-binding protein [Acidimicrobiales bacterium]
MAEDFEAFYRSQRAALVRLAHLLTASPAEAEELAQEALLATHQSWDRIDNPAGYARRALVNQVRSLQRRAVVRRRRPAPPPLLHALPVEYDETWAAIGRLSPDHRAVLVLRYYEDLLVEDIAELMGRPPGTIKSLLHRALKRLEEDLT